MRRLSDRDHRLAVVLAQQHPSLLAQIRQGVDEALELLDGPVGHGATGVFAEAAGAARAVLSGSTIAEVADAEARAAGAAMYQI